MPIVGDVLAERYRIEGVLGAGGMASVYRATDLRLDRQVAVKVLLPNLARDPALAARFDREARTLAAVAHPSVAAIFDVEPGDPASGREPFYVMELCDGGSLADRIEATGALDPAELVPIIEAIAEGLAELHRRGVIHRDVKPGNILFAGGGPATGGGPTAAGGATGARPKLADFGLAKPDGTAEATTLTAPGTMVGTLPYLAPELLGGASPTAASDVYALGATTFHGLTGRLPKPFDSLARFADARWTPAPTVSSTLPRLGTAFDAPVAMALAIEPDARPAPLELAADLARSLGRYHAEPPPGVAVAASGPAAVHPAAPAVGSIAPPTLVLPPPGVTAADAAAAGVAPAGGSAAGIAPAGLATRGSRLRGSSAAVAAAIGLLILAVLALAMLPGASPPSVPAATPSGPSPSPSATPSPSPSSTPTPAPAAAALQALDAVYAAIDQLRGGENGLRGGDAHELEQLADQVRGALAAGDFEAARVAAQQLYDKADKATDKFDPDRRELLLGAIRDLQAAIPAP